MAATIALGAIACKGVKVQILSPAPGDIPCMDQGRAVNPVPRMGRRKSDSFYPHQKSSGILQAEGD